MTRVNIKFCILLYKFTSKALWIPEEMYGKMPTKKMLVYKWHKRLCDGCVSMMICAVGDHHFWQMTKTSRVCAMLCEVTNERVFSRNISWKHSEYPSHTFEYALPLSTFGSTSVVGRQNVPWQEQYDGFGASTIFPRLVTVQLFPVLMTKKVFWKDNNLQVLRRLLQKQWKQWQR